MPLDRILIESDQLEFVGIEERLKNICRLIGESKGKSSQEIAALTTENFRAFLAPPS